MNAIILIIVLAALILVHEFGHFITAKFFGIRVDEFGLGLPPRAWGYKFRDTIYSLNWIPFGGFVRIYGEDGKEQASPTLGATGAQTPGVKTRGASFSDKSRWVQAGVVVAGIVFNILFAIILIWTGFMHGLTASTSSFPEINFENVRVMITGILPDSPADEAGIPAGSSISLLSSGYDSEENIGAPDLVTQFMASHTGKVVTINTQNGSYDVIPSPLAGIEIDLVGDLHMGPIEAITPAFKMTYALFVGTADSIYNLIISAVQGKASFNEVSGPVGIAGIVGDAFGRGLASLLYITAIISISLAVINLVPFPALDGGRLLFIMIEGIKGSPIKTRITNILNTAGFALLLLLMLFITYHDIVKLIR